MEVPTFDEMFRLIYKNLQFSGIPNDRPVLGVHFFVLCIALFLMIIEELSFFVSKISSENFLELTALAPCLGVGILSFVKIIAIAIKRHKIFSLTKSLKVLYEDILSDSTKKDLVTKEIALVKSLTKYYFVLNAILISVYNFSTLLLMLHNYLKHEKIVYQLPFAVLVPFSTDRWYTWLVVYTHSISSGFICVLFYVTVDALYCNLSSQVCNNFSVLANQIAQLNPTNTETLGEIVKKHQYILQLSEDLEEIFMVPNLFNILIGSIEICALGFNITTGDSDWTKLPGFILFLSSELLQIFVMSFFGENVIRESSKVGEAAYVCNWYNMDEISKKITLTIMIRSHRPQKLTAYKFSTICYGSFSKIISTSWSYFTILKTVYRPNEVISSE